jgi:hypothetical protein
MSEQDTSEVDGDRTNSEAQGGAREDDRNEKLDESPVPDPEATEGDADDDPGAD